MVKNYFYLIVGVLCTLFAVVLPGCRQGRLLVLALLFTISEVYSQNNESRLPAIPATTDKELMLLQLDSTIAAEFKVISQITGFAETNCYLIYDVKSKEAAIIDPGWQPDTIITFIEVNDLNLKYIFLTHGHTDHSFYVSELKRKFPKAKLCINRIDFNQMFTQFQWFKENYGQEFIEKERSNPEHKAYIDFDPGSIGIPDIFVENNQSYKLGSTEIKTIHTPGHSPGEICYYTKNVLFSGDVLFYRTVGGIHNQGSSRKLYEIFPDSTIIYPGHGQISDIGSEKRENENISLDNESIK